MAEEKLITRIRTNEGDLRIDYEAIANHPQIDITLETPGAAADAKTVGDKIKGIEETIKGMSASGSSSTIKINNKTYVLATDNITLDSTTLTDLAPKKHEHNASDVTDGTLPVTRGGTGAGNGKDGLKNLLAAGPMILSTNQYGTSAKFEAMKEENNAVVGQIFFVKVQ
jgi:hypothetical protein